MIGDIVRVSERSVRLCCNKKNCPVITDLGNGMIEILDDYGNKVIIKKEEALLLSDGVKTINGEKLLLG